MDYQKSFTVSCPKVSRSPSLEKKCYVVFKGGRPGIYETWEECSALVLGFPDAVYRRFPSRNLAEAAYKSYLANQGEIGEGSKEGGLGGSSNKGGENVDGCNEEGPKSKSGEEMEIFGAVEVNKWLYFILGLVTGLIFGLWKM